MLIMSANYTRGSSSASSSPNNNDVKEASADDVVSNIELNDTADLLNSIELFIQNLDGVVRDCAADQVPQGNSSSSVQQQQKQLLLPNSCPSSAGTRHPQQMRYDLSHTAMDQNKSGQFTQRGFQPSPSSASFQYGNEWGNKIATDTALYQQGHAQNLSSSSMELDPTLGLGYILCQGPSTPSVATLSSDVSSSYATLHNLNRQFQQSQKQNNTFKAKNSERFLSAGFDNIGSLVLHPSSSHEESGLNMDNVLRLKQQARNDESSSDISTSRKQQEPSIIEKQIGNKKMIVKKFQQRRSNPRLVSTSAFPSTLHHLLEHAEEGGYDKYISWQSHGRAFRVHDPVNFVSFVMPRFFHQTRYTSFQRQLALYGFVRMTKAGKDRGSYYHDLFLKGYPDLCLTIRRVPIKSAHASQRQREQDANKDSMPGPTGRNDELSNMASSRIEPNFYEMKQVPLPSTNAAALMVLSTKPPPATNVDTTPTSNVVPDFEFFTNDNCKNSNDIIDQAHHLKSQQQQQLQHQQLLQQHISSGNNSVCNDQLPNFVFSSSMPSNHVASSPKNVFAVGNQLLQSLLNQQRQLDQQEQQRVEQNLFSLPLYSYLNGPQANMHPILQVDNSSNYIRQQQQQRQQHDIRNNFGFTSDGMQRFATGTNNNIFDTSIDNHTQVTTADVRLNLNQNNAILSSDTGMETTSNARTKQSRSVDEELIGSERKKSKK